MTIRVILCLDGCGPEYLAGSETPNLDALAREGFHAIGEAVVPTVTNVNNTSIITASHPGDAWDHFELFHRSCER